MPEKQVNMYEAKTHLSRLVDEVEAGTEVVIARNGRPVARLVPYADSRSQRTPGSMRGQIWISPDFDDEDERITALWENSVLIPPDPADADPRRDAPAAERGADRRAADRQGIDRGVVDGAA